MKLAIGRVVGLAIALGLSGCAGANTDADEVRGVTQDAILIGMWAPLTGPAASWGAVARGTDTYFQMINAEGGIHGRRLELIARDDGYQPSRTIAVVRDMVERDGVFALVGGVGTATGRAVLDYIVTNEVPWVSPASGATYWAYPPKRYVFAQTTPYVDEAAVLVDYAVTELSKRRVAVVYQNDDYGTSGLIGARLALEAHGLALAETLPVEVLDTDLGSHAIRLREADVDAVLMWLTPRQAAMIVRETTRLGHRPQWLASSALSDTRLLDDLTGGGWEGVVFATTSQLAGSDHPLLQTYLEASARVAPDERAGDFFLSGFRQAEPLVEALRRAGPDLDADRLVEALESLKGFEGIGAPLTFGPEHRQGSRSVYLARSGADGSAVRLSGWIESGIDIEQAIRALSARR